MTRRRRKTVPRTTTGYTKQLKISFSPLLFISPFFRRESGNCRVCWSADAANDVKVSGKTNIAAGVILVRHLHLYQGYI